VLSYKKKIKKKKKRKRKRQSRTMHDLSLDKIT